jgi:hypothetical protein
VSALPLTALGLLLAAHLFDYASFLAMTARHGLAAELNPLVVRIAEDFGLPGITIAKLASVVFLGTMVLILAPHRRRAATAMLTIGIAVGVFGGLSNIASM